jgi:hypothetical protein
MPEVKEERRISPAVVIIPIGLGLVAVVGIAALAFAAPEEPPEPPPGLANLYGKVTDAVTGEELSGVYVALWDSAGMELLGSTYTNGSGNYIIENILPGSYILQFSKAGYETAVY